MTRPIARKGQTNLDRFRMLALGLGLGVTFSATLAVGQAQAQDAAADPVVAVVEGQEITRSQLEMLQSSLSPEIAALPLATVYDGVLDFAVNLELLGTLGREAGLTDSPIYQARLRQSQNQLLFELYVQSIVETEVTEDALRTRYDAFVAANPPGEEVRARHILVRSEEEAREIIAKLDAGGDFAELAQGTVDRGSAARGGDLGYFGRGMMVPPFEAAAFGLNVGETTKDPVQTQFGWHVIRLEDKRSAAAPEFGDVEAELREEMVQEIYGRVIDGAREGADVTTFTIEGAPRTP